MKAARLAAGVTAGISLALAATLAGGGSARAVPAARATAGKGTSPASIAPASTRYTVAGNLFGVSADATSDAWAVGYSGAYSGPGALIAHWNGRSWARESSPTSAGELRGVVAVSPSSAWAVGGYGAAPYHPWLLSWNGRAWHTVKLPGSAPGELTAVTATATDAWAVGVNGSGNPIALHWTQARPTWSFVAAPALGGGAGNALDAVASVSPSNAWAAGEQYPNGVPQSTLIRWRTGAWRRQAFPVSGSYQYLDGLAADSDGLAWGVGTGEDDIYGSIGAVSMYWNGRTWGAVPVPGGSASSLYGVAAGPAHAAWAVGTYGTGTLALRWTGRGWTRAATPNVLDSPALQAVTDHSATDAWAVGFGYPSAGSTTEETLILHWNGRTWS